MENELALEQEEASNKQTPLMLAVILSLSAYAVTFFAWFYEDHGVLFSSVVFDHPAALSEYLAGALGGSLIFPIVHVGVASFFKSKRNPSSRRNIFIGWSIAIIVIRILMVATGTPKL